MRATLFLSLLLSAGLGHAACADTLVANGGFDTGDLNGWTANAAVFVSSSSEYQGVQGGYNTVGTSPFAVLGPAGRIGGTLTQVLATVAGTAYTLSFSYGAFGVAPQSLQVSVGDLNTVVTASSPTYDLSNLLRSYSFDFVASGPTTTLAFTDLTTLDNGGSSDGFLDNVAVVPEPGAAGLLAAGIFALGISTRRRHRAA